MKRPLKLLILAITLLPVIQMMVFMGWFFIFSRYPEGDEPWLLDTRLMTFIWLPLMSVFYIRHLIKKVRLVKWAKVVWAVLLVLGNMYTMPVYWYFYIWRLEPPTFS